MNATAETTIEGADTLARTLRQLGRDLDDFTAANATAARTVGTAAAQQAPRRTGRLAGSWRPEPTPQQAAVRFGGGGVAYAPAMQWGIGPRGGLRGPHNIRATYFASGALSGTQEVWTADYRRDLEAKVGKVKGA